MSSASSAHADGCSCGVVGAASASPRDLSLVSAASFRRRRSSESLQRQAACVPLKMMMTMMMMQQERHAWIGGREASLQAPHRHSIPEACVQQIRRRAEQRQAAAAPERM
jgi:hypothetical protein